MPPVDRRIFLREYTRALRDGDSGLFVGAGISRAAGYVDWKQLLREIAEASDRRFIDGCGVLRSLRR
jgi:hypothetical protein